MDLPVDMVIPITMASGFQHLATPHSFEDSAFMMTALAELMEASVARRDEEAKLLAQKVLAWVDQGNAVITAGMNWIQAHWRRRGVAEADLGGLPYCLFRDTRTERVTIDLRPQVFLLRERGYDFEINPESNPFDGEQPDEFNDLWQRHNARYQEMGKAVIEWYERTGGRFNPSKDSIEATTSPTLHLYTTQELDTFASAQADGHTGRNYRYDPQSRGRIYKKSDNHYIELRLTDQEIDDGLDEHALESLTSAQDADGILATYYVCSLLAPITPIPANTAPVALIDLDDVISKIGWDPRSTQEREQMRAKVYDYLKFGARARLKGFRSGVTLDPDTRQPIDTRIDAPVWAFGATEKAIQPSLIGSYDVPIRQELFLSREWLPFLTDKRLVQYLPLGELLGSIRANQPGGAWARILGLSLANFWRRHPRETIAGTMKPTRRELLERYTPKKSPPSEIFDSNWPGRVPQYWGEALAILADKGFIAREGEAARPNMSKMPRYNWKDIWLDERVDIKPGPEMLLALKVRAATLPPPKPPKDLKENPKRRTRRKT